MKQVISWSSTGGSKLGVCAVDCVVGCVGLVSGEVGSVVTGGSSGIDPMLHWSSKQWS